MAWYQRLPGFKPRAPLRAGVLNTGELVLIDDGGHAQIFTEGTTDLIRDVLDQMPDYLATVELRSEPEGGLRSGFSFGGSEP